VQGDTPTTVLCRRRWTRSVYRVQLEMVCRADVGALERRGTGHDEIFRAGEGLRVYCTTTRESHCSPFCSLPRCQRAGGKLHELEQVGGPLGPPTVSQA